MAIRAKSILKKLKGKKVIIEKRSSYDKFKEKKEYEKIRKYTEKYGPLPGGTTVSRIEIGSPSGSAEPSETVAKPPSKTVSTKDATFVIEGPVTFQGGLIPTVEEERRILRKDENILAIPEEWKTLDYSGFDERYPLQKGVSSAHIYWDKVKEVLRYDVVEPKLNKFEEASLNRIEDILGQELEVDFQKLGESNELTGYIQKKVEEVCRELGIKLSKREFETGNKTLKKGI